MFRPVLPVLLLALASCGAIGDIIDRTTLTDAELQDVKDNYQGAMRAFNDLGDFAMGVADGTIDISTSTYDPPTAENGWQGTLHYQGPDFPGGDGNITLTFTVTDGNNQPVDPFQTDITNDPTITAVVGIDFSGTTKEGAPLDLQADFTLGLDQTDPSRNVVSVDGSFTIRHNDYVAKLKATSFVLSYDPATGVAQEATGVIDGTIDIPNFAFDADVTLKGNGETLAVDVAVLNQTVDNGVVNIADFQAAGG
jgi:hypothetical protein